MTNRRTVDITVDAYDAPMLAALAKRREHQRALGHADGAFRVSPIRQAWRITAHDEAVSAADIKDMREEQACSFMGPESLTILLGEVAEVLEEDTIAGRIYELLDVAAVCIRVASEMQANEDALAAMRAAKGGA